MSIQISLNKLEMAIVKFVAQTRRSVDRKEGIHDKRYATNRDGLELDILGFAGELAFAKFMKTYPDFSFKPRSGGHDFIVKGKTVDVKTTAYVEPWLKVALWKVEHPCDYYVLLKANESYDVFEVVGYMSKEDLFQDKYKEDLGHGETYVVRYNQLRKLKE